MHVLFVIMAMTWYFVYMGKSNNEVNKTKSMSLSNVEGKDKNNVECKNSTYGMLRNCNWINIFIVINNNRQSKGHLAKKFFQYIAITHQNIKVEFDIDKQVNKQ